MHRFRHSYIPSILIAAVLVLILSQVLTGPAARAQAPGGIGPQSMAGGDPITYYAGKGNGLVRVPPRVPPGGVAVQAATITVNYRSSGTNAFGDTCVAWPAAAVTAFNYAASIWAANLNSAVTIKIDACWASNLSGGILGHSGSYNNYSTPHFSVAGTWYPSTLADALDGTSIDTNASNPDMVIAYASSGINWYFPTDGATPSGSYDLVTVVLHEIAHGLGFAGTMYSLQGTGKANWGFSSKTGYPGAYDRFVENGAGTSVLNTGSFPNDSSQLLTVVTSNDLYFDGAHADAANGGSRPKIYAPASWNGGSSYSHLDTIYDSPPAVTAVNALMTWSLNDGESIHDPGPIALGVLQDVGWTIASPATPTPTSTPTATPTSTPTATPTNTPVPAPDVSIQKAAILGRPFTPGDRITYTLNVANLGNLPANGVRVTDTLPAALLDRSVASSLVITSMGGANYAWTVAPLAAGASGVISVYARIDPSLAITSVVVNTAQISNPGDRDPRNNSSTAYSGRFTVFLPLVMRDYGPPAPPTATPTVTATPAPGWVTVASEGFEGAFPGSWAVLDNDGVTSGTYYWAKRNCRAYTGSYGGWAVAGGANGAALNCGASYPDNADSWMVFGPFSLVGATAADMKLKLWLDSESGYDYFYYMASTDGTNFYGTKTSGHPGAWQDRVIDLGNVYTLGSVLGQPNVWVAFLFQSDYSNQFPEGAVVDDIVIRKCVTGSCVGAGAAQQADLPGVVSADATATLPPLAP